MLFGGFQEGEEILSSNSRQILAVVKRTRCSLSFICFPEERLVNCLVSKMFSVNPKYLSRQRYGELFWLEIRYPLVLQVRKLTGLPCEHYGASSPGNSAGKKGMPWSRKMMKELRIPETRCACCSIDTHRV